MKARLLFLPALLLSGCATVPSTSTVMNGLTNAHSVPSAEVTLKSDAPLVSNQPVKGELGPGAPVVQLKQGNSYYRLYRLTPVDGALHLKVTSYCACFGFDKHIAVPVIRVLTKSGHVIEPSSDGYEYAVEGAHGFTPLSVTLDVTVPGAKADYALVAADNSRPGASVNRINIGGLMQLDVQAYPLGRFDIRHVSP
jgi:hypothetical protein